MRDIVAKVVNGHALNDDDAHRAVRLITTKEANDAQVSAFITAITAWHRSRGVAADTVVALVRALRAQCEKIQPVTDRPVIDTSGTGGGPGTFNISTAAAFVAAAGDIPVAKQGVRSIWNAAGGADVLEALGADIKLTPESVEQLISEVGIGFLYAPLFHPALRRIFTLEQAIGIKSLFHTLIVPFTNAAGARRHLLGVADEATVELVLPVVQELQYDRVLIVHGQDGTDEISITGPTDVIDVQRHDGGTYDVQRYTVRPEDFGFTPAGLADIADDEAPANAMVLREVLSGRERGPKRRAVLLNAAGALVVGGKVDSLAEGVALAGELVDDGWAEIKMHEMVEVSKRLPSVT